MNYPRCCHALTKLSGFAYIFGGESIRGADKICEKYNVHDNEWSEIAQLPTNGNYAYATTHDDMIFITAQSWDHILRYKPDTNTYYRAGDNIPRNIGKILLSFDNELILMTGNLIKSIDKDEEGFGHKQPFPWTNTEGVEFKNQVFWMDRYNSIVSYDISQKKVARFTSK